MLSQLGGLRWIAGAWRRGHPGQGECSGAQLVRMQSKGGSVHQCPSGGYVEHQAPRAGTEIAGEVLGEHFPGPGPASHLCREGHGLQGRPPASVCPHMVIKHLFHPIAPTLQPLSVPPPEPRAGMGLGPSSQPQLLMTAHERWTCGPLSPSPFTGAHEECGHRGKRAYWYIPLGQHKV